MKSQRNKLLSLAMRLYTDIFHVLYMS